MKVTGKATLIRYTAMPEETVAAAARLCYTTEDAGDLVEIISKKDNADYIERLLKMNHLSPFEHASFTFILEDVSRALLAQITRHRIASFSVRSQRYVSEGEFDYIIPPAIEEKGESYVLKFKGQMAQMLSWYNEWQEVLGGKSEKANEDARFVLPNACATQMMVTMNARELMHFFALRCCNRAQWEIRDIAWQMLKAAEEVAPNIFKASGAGCVSGACPEGKKTCGKMLEVREKKAALKRAKE